jgi:hypothetical protein
VIAISKALNEWDEADKGLQNIIRSGWRWKKTLIEEAVKRGGIFYHAAICMYANGSLLSHRERAVPTLEKAFKINDLSGSEGESDIRLRNSSIDSENVLTLTKVIRDGDEITRMEASQALKRIGFEIAAVLPDFTKMLNDKDILVSTDTAYTYTC